MQAWKRAGAGWSEEESTVPRSTAPSRAVQQQHHAAQHGTAPRRTARHRATPRSIAPHSTASRRTTPGRAVQYNTAARRTAPRRTTHFFPSYTFR